MRTQAKYIRHDIIAKTVRIPECDARPRTLSQAPPTSRIIFADRAFFHEIKKWQKNMILRSNSGTLIVCCKRRLKNNFACLVWLFSVKNTFFFFVKIFFAIFFLLCCSNKVFWMLWFVGWMNAADALPLGRCSFHQSTSLVPPKRALADLLRLFGWLFCRVSRESHGPKCWALNVMNETKDIWMSIR